jgi:hypothetical protein
MTHELPKGGTVNDIHFCPYEDLLGIGYSEVCSLSQYKEKMCDVHEILFRNSLNCSYKHNKELLFNENNKD